MIFAENSTKLHELGYNVLPCRGKEPMPVLFKYWLTNKQPVEVVDGWSLMYPDSNIAVMTGIDVVVVDVDTLDKELTKKARALCKELLPPTPMVKIGKKGFSLFYRGTGIKKHNSRTLALDILAQGCYTVIPPSIHPETKQQYMWESGSVLTHVKELEEITEEMIENLKNAFQAHGIFKPATVRAAMSGHISHDGGCARGNRNNYFSQFVWDLICNREIKSKPLTDQDIVEKLLEEDALHLGADNYFGDASEWRGSADRVANARQFFQRHLKAAIEKDAIYPNYFKPRVEQSVIESSVESGVKEMAIDEMSKLNHYHFIESQRKRLFELIPKDGLIEWTMAYTFETSNSKSPVMPFVGALGLCSVLAGNVYSVLNNWSNLYLMTVAFSGSGKSFPQKAIIKILNQAGRGAESLIGVRSYGSAEGILSDLPLRPKRSRIDLYDEFGSFLKEIKDGKHFKKAKEVVMNMWSESSSETGSRALARNSVLTIKNPCITMLGFTTPDEFKDNIDKNFVKSGLGTRFMYFCDDLLPTDARELSMRSKILIHPEIINRVRDIWSIQPEREESSGTVISVNSMKEPSDYEKACLDAHRVSLVPYGLELTVSARDYLNLVVKRATEAIHAYQEGVDIGETDYRSSILTRKVEQVLRLSLCYAVSQNKRDVIDVEHLEWAERVFDYQLANVTYHMDGVFDRVFSAEQVYSALRRWFIARKVVSRSEFKRQLIKLSRGRSLDQIDRDLSMIEKTFLEENILEVTKKTHNRSIYWHCTVS